MYPRLNARTLVCVCADREDMLSHMANYGLGGMDGGERDLAQVECMLHLILRAIGFV